jgi:hypothetical protein
VPGAKERSHLGSVQYADGDIHVPVKNRNADATVYAAFVSKERLGLPTDAT